MCFLPVIRLNHGGVGASSTKSQLNSHPQASTTLVSHCGSRNLSPGGSCRFPNGLPVTSNSAIAIAIAGSALSLAAESLPDTADLREFLAFKPGAEEYGVDIPRAQEIRSCEEPTRIAHAHAPAFVKGVVNLRGVIAPIIDVRMRFDLEQVGDDRFTVVIVPNIGRRAVGMVVDGVPDAIALASTQPRQVPEFNSTIRSDHLLAVGSIDDRTLILTDIEKLISGAGTGLVERTLH